VGDESRMTVKQWVAMREENLTGYSLRVAFFNATILLTSPPHGKTSVLRKARKPLIKKACQ